MGNITGAGYRYKFRHEASSILFSENPERFTAHPIPSMRIESFSHAAKYHAIAAKAVLARDPEMEEAYGTIREAGFQ